MIRRRRRGRDAEERIELLRVVAVGGQLQFMSVRLNGSVTVPAIATLVLPTMAAASSGMVRVRAGIVQRALQADGEGRLAIGAVAVQGKLALAGAAGRRRWF